MCANIVFVFCTETLEQRFSDLLSPESEDRHVFEVTLRRESPHGIGITIVGGESTGRLDLGIFIKSVTPGGPADRDGRIKPGDRLIAINDQSLEGMQHHVAVQLIRNATEHVKLLISQVRPPDYMPAKQISSESQAGLASSGTQNGEDQTLSPGNSRHPFLPSNIEDANEVAFQDVPHDQSEATVKSFTSPQSPSSETVGNAPKQGNPPQIVTGNNGHTSAEELYYADYSSDFFQPDESYNMETSFGHPYGRPPHQHPPHMRLDLGDLEASRMSHPSFISQNSLDAELQLLGIGKLLHDTCFRS